MIYYYPDELLMQRATYSRLFFISDTVELAIKRLKNLMSGLCHRGVQQRGYNLPMGVWDKIKPVDRHFV